MAQDKGGLHHKIADGPGLVIMHIGTADAYIFQLNQNFRFLTQKRYRVGQGTHV